MVSETYAAELVECFSCGGVYPRRELSAVGELPGYRWPRYCRHCAAEIRAAYARQCLLCGESYLARLPDDPPGLCENCANPERLRELERVRYHLARATALGLLATLTLDRWLATVEHFAGRCAYCGAEPFRDLDHFVPMAAGGGTTASNCVPACSRCNSRKSALDLRVTSDGPFEPGVLARVAAFLKTQVD